MYCTVSRFQAKTETLEDIARAFKVQYIPIISQQPGFRDNYLLTRPDGRFIIINNWDTKQQADEWFKNAEYQNIIFQLRPLLKSAESPEGYKIEAHSGSEPGK